MKMVSQLTRQAMSRHRDLSAASASSRPEYPVFSAPASADRFDLRPSASSVTPRPDPPRNTLYSQLMKSHDRMTGRHLRQP